MNSDREENGRMTDTELRESFSRVRSEVAKAVVGQDAAVTV